MPAKPEFWRWSHPTRRSRRFLKSIVLLMEKQEEGLVYSILVLSADGIHVQHGAAPSLPEAYVKAVNGAPIGPRNGSCGTAMFLRKPIVVTDVLTESLLSSKV